MAEHVTSFLTSLVRVLGEVEIAYMVTGSVASTAYGEPRTTYDVDIIIDPTAAQLEALIARAPGHWVIFPEAAWDAFRTRGMFNIIVPETGEKADLILRKDRPFSRTEFSRRRVQQLEEFEITLASPEDVILSKLEWAKIGESERQYRDALGVALTQARTMDRDYLRKWAVELGVGEELQHVLSQLLDA